MFEQVFERISDIGALPAIALILFFVIFSLIVLWALLLDKSIVDKMKRMPLESDELAQNGEANHG